METILYNSNYLSAQDRRAFLAFSRALRASLRFYVGERAGNVVARRSLYLIVQDTIAVTRCTGSGDIYVTVKGVKCSGKVSRATIGRRLP